MSNPLDEEAPEEYDESEYDDLDMSEDGEC